MMVLRLHVPGYLPPLDFFKLTPPVPALTDPSKSCSKTFHSRIESNKYLLRIHSFFLFSILTFTEIIACKF